MICILCKDADRAVRGLELRPSEIPHLVGVRVLLSVCPSLHYMYLVQ